MLLACPEDPTTRRCSFATIVALVGLAVYSLTGVGEKQNLYEKGQDYVDVRVNALTSSSTLIPMDYYSLPFCQEENGARMRAQNLGQYMMGDQIKSTPMKFLAGEEAYCKVQCIAHLGNRTSGSSEPDNYSDTIEAIRKNYKIHFIIDGMPLAVQQEDAISKMTRYFGGQPIGYKRESLAHGNKQVENHFIHNHYIFQIYYRKAANSKLAILRTFVQPMSINYEFQPSHNGIGVDFVHAPEPCKSHSGHTSWDESQKFQPQPASGQVIFTYDVTWIESDIDWAQRWENFITADHAIPERVHWMSILNGTIVLVVLTLVVGCIWRRNISGYQQLRVDDEEETPQNVQQTNIGWKAIRGDVFRPPSQPLLLSLLCGTGAHLLCCMVVVFILSCIRLYPSQRGIFLLRSILVYALTGCVNGFVSMRLYKSFNGRRNFTFVGTIAGIWFPVVALALYVCAMIPRYLDENSYGLPVMDFVVLCFIWLLFLLPMTLAGAFVARRTPPVRFPVKPNEETRAIPPITTRRCLGILVCNPMSPISLLLWPFASMFVEYYFAVHSFLDGYPFNWFGVSLLVIVVVLATTVATCIILHFFILLKCEDHKWWWKVYVMASVPAWYTFFYDLVVENQIHLSGTPTLIIYMSYSVLQFVSFFLMFAFVGFAACLWFNIHLYKVFENDEGQLDSVIELAQELAQETPGETPQELVQNVETETSKEEETKQEIV